MTLGVNELRRLLLVRSYSSTAAASATAILWRSALCDLRCRKLRVPAADDMDTDR